MRPSTLTLDVLPKDLATEVRDQLPGLSHMQHFGTEAGRELLDSVGSDKIFRRRSE